MFRFTLRPRLSETDGLRHINNTALPAWFEEARRDLFELFNPGLSLTAWNLILKKYEIELVAQINHTDELEIVTRVAKIGTKSLTVIQEAFQNDKPVATCRSVIVYFDYASNQTEPIPATIVERLQEHLVAA